MVSIDRDPYAIEKAKSLVEKFGVRLKIINGRFSNLEQILLDLNITKINGITFDFGVSSPQIDTPERGFSFRFDSLLDMRMGGNEFSATDLLNKSEVSKIEKILREYGEEKKARQSSRAIVAERPIEKTKKLTSRSYSILGGKKRDKINQATRTVQEIRNTKGRTKKRAGISLKSQFQTPYKLKRDIFYHFPIYLEAYNKIEDHGRDPLFRTRP